MSQDAQSTPFPSDAPDGDAARELAGALADLRALVGRHGTLDAAVQRRAPGGFMDRLPEAEGLGWSFPTRLAPAEDEARRSAVLVLFGALDDRPAGHLADAVPEELDVLLTQRASTLRQHAGQVAFPGGALDPEDASMTACALREAHEETGLDPAGVKVIGELPAAPLAVSNFLVTPVLGWWDRPSEVFVVDEGEASRVFRVPVADLVDPEHRVTTVRKVSTPAGNQGFKSPGFLVADTLVWGFTAILLDRLLDLLGWSQPWDRGRLLDVQEWSGASRAGRLD